MTGISDRMKSYVQKIGNPYHGITVTFEENIDFNKAFSPEKALHLLRIMQEAFHNALKHSRCTEIKFLIKSNEEWHIGIIDNGIGFNIMVETNTGGGLSNMQQRAKMNQWHFEVQQLVPGGTAVQVSGAWQSHI